MRLSKPKHLHTSLGLFLLLFIDQVSAYYSIRVTNKENEDWKSELFRSWQYRKAVEQEKVSPTTCHHITLRPLANKQIKPNLDGFAVWNLGGKKDETVHAMAFYLRQLCKGDVPHTVVLLDKDQLDGVHYANFRDAGVPMEVHSYRDLDYEKEIQPGGLLAGLPENAQGSILEWNQEAKKWDIFEDAVRYKPSPEGYNADTGASIITKRLREEAASMADEELLPSEDLNQRQSYMMKSHARSPDAFSEPPKESPLRISEIIVPGTTRDLDEYLYGDVSGMEKAFDRFLARLEGNSKNVDPNAHLVSLTDTLAGRGYFSNNNDEVVPVGDLLEALNKQPSQEENIAANLVKNDSEIKSDGNLQDPEVSDLEKWEGLFEDNDPAEEENLGVTTDYHLYNQDTGSAVVNQYNPVLEMTDVFQDPIESGLSGSEDLFKTIMGQSKNPTDDFLFGNDQDPEEPYYKKLKPSPTDPLRTRDRMLMDPRYQDKIEEVPQSGAWAAAFKALNTDS